MNWESSIDIYILPYVKYVVGGKHRKLSSTLYDDLKGWDGEVEGGSRGRGYMYTYSWLILLYSRN